MQLKAHHTLSNFIFQQILDGGAAQTATGRQCFPKGWRMIGEMRIIESSGENPFFAVSIGPKQLSAEKKEGKAVIKLAFPS